MSCETGVTDQKWSGERPPSRMKAKEQEAGAGDQYPPSRMNVKEQGAGAGDQYPPSRMNVKEQGAGAGDQYPPSRMKVKEQGAGAGDQRPPSRMKDKEQGAGGGKIAPSCTREHGPLPKAARSREPIHRLCRPSKSSRPSRSVDEDWRVSEGAGAGDQRPPSRMKAKEQRAGAGDQYPPSRMKAKEQGAGAGDQRPPSRMKAKEQGAGAGDQRPPSRMKTKEQGAGAGDQRPPSRMKAKEQGAGAGDQYPPSCMKAKEQGAGAGDQYPPSRMKAKEQGAGAGDQYPPSRMKTKEQGAGAGDQRPPSRMKAKEQGAGAGDQYPPSRMKAKEQGAGAGDQYPPSSMKAKEQGAGAGDQYPPSSMKAKEQGAGPGDQYPPSSMKAKEQGAGAGDQYPPSRMKAKEQGAGAGDQYPPNSMKAKEQGAGAGDQYPPSRMKAKEQGGGKSSSSKLPSGAIPPLASSGDPGNPFSYSTFEWPTVVGQLHNILSQYPDNGQIIKELVQNAEDAGATRVEAVHFPEPLRQPGAREEVQRFIEGPGLCLFNDATFSEEDWHGIRKLGDSVKENDPVRVGQFGLGFKSVFHLTDYVTIISGTQALFMDPSETEDKMCRSLPLDKLTEVLPDPSSHQAFEYYLTKHLKADSNLPGTLFWFPLRRSASKISDTLYTSSHVENLFRSFAVEADICLTFLKSLEKVTLGIHTAGKVNVTHSMTITSRAAEEVRNKKRSFRQSLCQSRGSLSSALSCSYETTLTTRVRGREVQKQTLRVLHLLPGEEDEEWMTWTGRNKDKHIPLVGVAVPVSPPAAPRAKGHIFSLLPLPPDPSSQTDLPIQVNGTFVLSQNRRQVKWRTSESSINETDVVWNEDLVSKVVPRAYLELLKELLEEAKEGSFSADTWYTFLPSLRGTAGRWHEMAKQVWCGLLDLPVIATEVRGFLPPREVLASNTLSEEEPELATAVRKALLQEKLPIAILPDHVQASIHALGQQLSVVTPELLRQTLQGKGSSDLGGEETCQQLLCYAAKDKQHHGLHGLPLLPLQDGSWSTFSRGGSDSAVYLCSAVEAEALLGLEGLMASTCVVQPAWEALQDVAHSGKTQLRPFQPELHGPDLLLKSARHVQRCQPPLQQVDQWLGKVWTLLQDLPLCSVENIPLLPTSQPPNSASLSPLSSPVVVQGKGGWLSRPQVEALELLGVVVVPALPKHVQHKDLHEYLSAADRHGTTQALGKVVRQDQEKEAVTRFNTHKTEHQRQAVSSFIEVSSIQPPLAGFLTKLHMFKAQDTNKLEQDSHLEKVNTIAPELVDFPVSYPETLLTPTQRQEMELALELGAHKLSKEELCIKALRSGHSDDSVLALVQYILEDPQLERSSSVREQLRNSKFVPNIDGSLCRPSELYDPEDEDHCVLIGEPQQPKDSFCNHYPLLRSLGLRKVQDMPQDELVCLFEGLENSQLSKDDKARKSVGLLQAVNRRSDYLQVCRAVLGVPFVYGASSRPHGYPSSLGWATPPGPLVPQGLRSLKYSSVLGSTTALVECHDFPDVASAFGWASTPPVEPVIQHLKNLAAAYQLNEREYLDLIKQTYSQLSTALGEGGAPQLGSLKTECCVFTEHGFRLPDEVYIHPGDEDLRLLPYQHVLPFELRGSEQLFLCLGCARQQSPALLLAVLEKVRARHQGGGGSIDSSEVEKDRRLVMSVLDRLQHHLEELPGPLLVPVQTQDDVLELAEVQQAAYMEEVDAWLDSDELGVKVVHGCVATTLARALGVASLESFLTAGGEAVMEWGQREPLTTRLHNLLEQQYRDGVSILKELVQNADDAGATAVRLLYDERQNEDSRTLLLGPGMERCQGPALWVYNDALFSEQDFENLREVGAGTKELQPTKIGKFGLGFSSVYNLTDVPSFISGSSYVVFDPHMTHLSHATSPGRRYNFTNRRHSYMLRTLRGQFQPFSGVFGCDVVERGSFEGTLFRLPFRTAASKISDMCYSRGDMVQLLGMFSGVVGQLLLFTQHVSSISVFHLSASASSPSEMVELFHAGRGRCQPALVPGLASPATDGPQSVLERAAALFSKQKNRFEWKGECLAERSTAEVSVRCSRGGADLCGLEEGQWSTTWVTSWHSGSGSAGKLAEALGGKALPLAAVAVPVREDRCGCHPLSLTGLPLGFYREGHFHCFLPLPVKTLLPVQINGVLEVASDRTNLLTETEDDRHAHSWNTTLVGDAALRAHLGLAEALRCLGLGAESPYHAIWPVLHHGAGTLVERLTKGFYHALEHESLELFRCSSGDWHPLDRCRFLKQDFLQVPQVGDIAFEFMQTYFHSTSELKLVRLPQHILACLSEQVLSQQVVNEEAFYSRYFIPHMSEGLVSPDRRDQLMLHLLDAGHPCLESLPGLPCIPTQPQHTQGSSTPRRARGKNCKNVFCR
ncbi:sacsin-like isoform X8 [Eriocheir sinensis]|uniref:sacsin-like isoform X8 n=1 Tax=Eriocheir sinensis TaxID=95602 RepID=UPI0021C8162B|nr:sacsin-like isoform X8 [Eriocheir sinensis]